MKVVTNTQSSGCYMSEPAHAREPQKLRVQWEEFRAITVNNASAIIHQFKPILCASVRKISICQMSFRMFER